MLRSRSLCLLVLQVGSLSLVGCASSGVSDLYDFQPIESDDERKVFEYRYSLDHYNENSHQPALSRKAVSFSDMREELNKYMDVFLYCEQGYFVYDEVFDGREYALRGECQEPKNNE